MEKKSFVEKVGEEHAPRLIELFLQNEVLGTPTLTQIIALMPQVPLTLGRLVALRRDHPDEIKSRMRAYLLEFGAVARIGETNLGPVDTDRTQLAKLAAQFKAADLPPLKEGDRHARARRNAAAALVYETGDPINPVLERIINRVGVRAFLESEGIPKPIAELVERVRSK